MKLLLAAAMLLVAAARAKELISNRGGRPTIAIGKPQDYPKYDAESEEVQNENIQIEKTAIEDIWMSDFDEDTEAIRYMDMLPIILGRGREVAYGGIDWRALLTPAKRNDPYAVKSFQKLANRCTDMEDEARDICWKVNYAVENDVLKEKNFIESNDDSGWMKCCGPETDQERLYCFIERKAQRLNDLCADPVRSEYAKQCCQVDDEDRYECFDAMKGIKCGTLSGTISEYVHQHFDRNRTTKCDYNSSRWQVEERNLTSGNDSTNKTDKLKAKREMCKNRRMCCKAGIESVANQTETTSCDVCVLNFEAWAEDQENVTDVCANKFISCCMNFGSEEEMLSTIGKMHRLSSTNSTDMPPIVRMRNHHRQGKRFDGLRRNHDYSGGIHSSRNSYDGFQRNQPRKNNGRLKKTFGQKDWNFGRRDNFKD